MLSKALENVLNHELITLLLSDSHKLNLAKNDDEKPLSEYEYYVRRTAFFSLHFIDLCEQLEKGIELLSNFNYSKADKVSRIEHLKYNLENYYIRFNSLSDRLLQFINAVFHLGINPKNVNARNVLTNIKVEITQIPIYYKPFGKLVHHYDSVRNTIVLRHSHLDDKLDRFTLLYHDELTKEGYRTGRLDKDNFIHVRKKILTDFITARKNEFNSVNKECFESIIPIFDLLQKVYERQKEIVK